MPTKPIAAPSMSIELDKRHPWGVLWVYPQGTFAAFYFETRRAAQEYRRKLRRHGVRSALMSWGLA